MASAAMNGRNTNGGRKREAVSRRLDLDCSTIGFSAPPCSVQLKFLPNEGKGWTLVGLTPPAQPPTVARWLEAYEPTSIEIASGLAPKILHVNFEELPGTWRDMLGAVNVQLVELTPEGSASLFVEGTSEEIDQFVEDLETRQDEASTELAVRARKARTDNDDEELTPRQTEILSRAVGLGYYEIPHNLTLRELADRLDLSVGTVSELLRRAEAKIITRHVDSWVKTRWEGEADIGLETQHVDAVHEALES